MKLLNLDDLTAVRRTVQIEGVEYAIAEQTLGQLIEDLKIGRKTKRTEADMAQALLTQAQALLPDCPEDKLRKLNMRQLNALVEFARASDDDVVGETEAAEGKQ